VVLTTNHLSFDDPRVRTIKVGEDRQWGDNLLNALPQVPGDVLMLLLDDFFLNDHVNDAAVRDAVVRFRELNGRYLGVDRFSKQGKPLQDSTWHKILPDPPCVGLNATIWSAAHLREVVNSPGMNIWQAENRAKQLAREDQDGHFYIGPEGQALLTYQESIKGLFWKPSTLQFFKREQVPIKLSPRPCPVQGQDFISKFIRSWQKRRFRGWLDRRTKEFAAQGGGVVKPL
jgi:hypothetical protein